LKFLLIVGFLGEDAVPIPNMANGRCLCTSIGLYYSPTSEVMEYCVVPRNSSGSLRFPEKPGQDSRGECPGDFVGKWRWKRGAQCADRYGWEGCWVPRVGNLPGHREARMLETIAVQKVQPKRQLPRGPRALLTYNAAISTCETGSSQSSHGKS
jgi:hypothetical protein